VCWNRNERDVGAGAVEQSEVGEDEEEAEFGGAEEELRELEAREGVGGEEAFGGEKKEADEHGESDGPVREAGEGEAGEESGGAEEVGDVVDVEAEARALLVADAGECAVEGVAEPVERDAGVDGEEGERVRAREGVEEAGEDLCGEAEEGEVVGGDGAWCVAGEEFEEAFFRGRGEGAVDAERGCEGGCEGCGHD
jgi:hypothetical protein